MNSSTRESRDVCRVAWTCDQRYKYVQSKKNNRRAMPAVQVYVIRKILVVCAGNICRSPMAEGLLKDAFSKTLPSLTTEMTVKSCGLTALVGHPAADSAIELMRERGLDITGHRAQQIDTENINWADLILVMEERHREVIQTEVPSSRGKVFKLGKFSNTDIPDPYRDSKEKFGEVLGLIDTGVSEWVRETMRSETVTS